MSDTHTGLVRWTVLNAATAFSAYALWQHGALQTLFDADESHLSAAIWALFLVMTAHAGWRAIVLDRERSAVANLRRALATSGPPARVAADGALTQAGTPLPAGALTRHAARLAASVDPRQASAPLYDALEREVMGPQEVGWLVADLMVKLGLLGTVVGFILMLGSVEATGDIDIAAMKGMLTGMSAGMRTALFTTLSGLVAGALLGMQYHLLERSAETLLAEVAVATETLLLPQLAAGEAAR